MEPCWNKVPNNEYAVRDEVRCNVKRKTLRCAQDEKR